jgi:hypothetical protein
MDPTVVNDAQFEENVDALCGQIAKTVGVAAVASSSQQEWQKQGGVTTPDAAESLKDIRSELERLRLDVSGSNTTAATTSATVAGRAYGDMGGGGGGGGERNLCPLPAAVPPVSASTIQISDTMQALVDAVLSPTSKQCVGFFGMGTSSTCLTILWWLNHQLHVLGCDSVLCLLVQVGSAKQRRRPG